ncbi:putative MATE efflux family protein subfamily [Ilyonectria robusta]|uniref:putative MATE efflux family protein subfamily n=1 Tax=Ilyonectria robusta TaxID=1079257 RepID=UPI001E8DE213|nr:putative MATE efflux family protein subfamily [Ilyonectria robusta]KAH8684958.1 putative MATE efflux family protein subfamily [Ilyonectria robusta]
MGAEHSPSHHQTSGDVGEGEANGDDGQLSTLHLMIREARCISTISLPVILSYALQASFQTVSIFIVGRAVPHHLSTAAFSYGFATVSGWLVGVGGSTALDTLASSTFTGGKSKHALGILLQRATIVLTLMYIPIAVLWFFSRPLSQDSCTFLRLLIPGGLGYVYFETIKKYLQAQGIFRPGTYVLLFTAPLSALLNYLLVNTAGYGVFAAPIATGIGIWLSFLGLVAYIKFVDAAECWGGWDSRCLQRMGTFAYLAILGILHVGTEWWAFEIVTIIAGQLGTKDLAAQSAIMTLDAALATLPFGIGVATSTWVGNLLGLRDPRSAASSAHSAAIFSVLVGAVVGLLMILFKTQTARLFSPDPEVIQRTTKVLPLLALYQIADGLNASCGGALRGIGRQHVGAAVNVITYYCLALPLGAWLAWHGWGVQGLWIGQCGALILIGFAEWVIVGITNWDLQVERAFVRMD